jgi:hypothetical protein
MHNTKSKEQYTLCALVLTLYFPIIFLKRLYPELQGWLTVVRSQHAKYMNTQLVWQSKGMMTDFQ